MFFMPRGLKKRICRARGTATGWHLMCDLANSEILIWTSVLTSQSRAIAFWHKYISLNFPIVKGHHLWPGTIPRSKPNRFLRTESRCSQPTIGNYVTLVYRFLPIDEVHICPMNLRLGQHKKTSSLIRHQINLKVNLKNKVFARILE